MTANQLGEILFDMYSNAPAGEKVTMIHLFGIRYHKEIDDVGVSDVIEASKIRKSYETEVSKAIKLARYVRPIHG